jgi:hypothetical protein
MRCAAIEHGRVGRAVQQQDVQIVGTEATQACLDRRFDAFGAEVSMTIRPVAELRANDYPVASPRQRLSEQRFAAPAAVGGRGVDQGAAERERGIDDPQ